MAERINEHEYFPTTEQVAYFAGCRMSWYQDKQRFESGGWDWEARIGVCMDGRFRAQYYDQAYVTREGVIWESAKFDDPIACYVHAKLENWGN